MDAQVPDSALRIRSFRIYGFNQPGMENTGHHLWLVESMDMEPTSMDGPLYSL